LEEANLISKEPSIKTVVCLFPYKNDLGIQLLETTGIKVILEPITVNDVLIGNSNVVLKRIDLDKVTKSGIIIPDIVTQSRTRAVPCEVIACDIDCTRYEPGDTVIVDIISCQWLTFKNAQCIEDKFFTTLEKEILCKLEKEEN
jgi:co-chaperonin GroES (HSP10)